MASKNKRKGDGLLGFGIVAIILGVLLLSAPIGLPLLIVGVICLAAWMFARRESNADKRHGEQAAQLAQMQAELNELRQQKPQG